MLQLEDVIHAITFIKENNNKNYKTELLKLKITNAFVKNKIF